MGRAGLPLRGARGATVVFRRWRGLPMQAPPRVFGHAKRDIIPLACKRTARKGRAPFGFFAGGAEGEAKGTVRANVAVRPALMPVKLLG